MDRHTVFLDFYRGVSNTSLLFLQLSSGWSGVSWAQGTYHSCLSLEVLLSGFVALVAAGHGLC